MNSACKLAASLALLVGGTGSMALADTVLNFDDLTADTIVTNQYAAQGVTFTGAQILTKGVNLKFGEFPPFSGNNVVYDYLTSGIGKGIVRADAVGGTWSSVGGYITGNVAIKLEAFDASNNLLGATTTGGENFVSSGATPNIFLQVVAPKIAYVLFHDDGNSFTLDNFTFQASNNVTPVPLPAAAWAGMAMLGGLATARKARQRLASR